jgi:hypothetical protein
LVTEFGWMESKSGHRGRLRSGSRSHAASGGGTKASQDRGLNMEYTD